MIRIPDESAARSVNGSPANRAVGSALIAENLSTIFQDAGHPGTRLKRAADVPDADIVGAGPLVFNASKCLVTKIGMKKAELPSP